MGSAEDALAMALAKITGHVEMRPRSLLTAHEDYTTLQFVSPWPVEKPGQVGTPWPLAHAALPSQLPARCPTCCPAQKHCC